MTVAAAAFHWLEYVGLLAGLGSFVVRRLARLQPRIHWADPPMAVFFATAAIGAIGLVVVQDSWLVGVRAVAEAIAYVMCRRGLRFVAVPGVVAALALPLSSHAVGLGAQFADAVHVLSAAMWAGGIAALLTLRPPGGWATADAALLLERFGRVAFVAFAVTALTGLLIASEHLNALNELWSTSYGLALALKAAGVVVMAGLSLVWRRDGPFRVMDAAVLLGVVLGTSLLAVLPPPA